MLHHIWLSFQTEKNSLKVAWCCGFLCQGGIQKLCQQVCELSNPPSPGGPGISKMDILQTSPSPSQCEKTKETVKKNELTKDLWNMNDYNVNEWFLK